MIESILLFPGMILHELAHALACILLGVKVTRTKLWGPTGASVTHQATTGWKNFLVSIAPFFVNTPLALLSFYIGHAGVHYFAFIELEPILKIMLFYWLGVSFSFFAFPSETDLKSGWRTLWKHYANRMLFGKGIISAFLHWITAPLLFPAWIVLTVFGLINHPRMGLLWALALFLATALFVGI